MIIKDIVIPPKILKLEAVNRRLVRPHPTEEKIYADYRKFLAGYQGEMSLKYFLELIPNMTHYIFLNIRIASAINNSFFQIDVLIMTPYFFLILEVKNYSGSLTYDPNFNQLTQIYNDEEKYFSDPILQAERQRYQLSAWFKKKNIEKIPPIYYYVVMSNPRSKIESTSKNHFHNNKIIRPDFINQIILELYKRKSITIDDKYLKKICTLLKKAHSEEEFDVCKRYKIKKDDIKNGVICSSCRKGIMTKRKYDWICFPCNTKSTSAHKDALKDFAYIFGSAISNKDIRHFLKIQSRHSAYHLANSLNLKKIGQSKSTKYILPY